MQITVSVRHAEITSTMKQYAEDKAGKLPRYYDHIDAIEVTLNREGIRHLVEIVVHADRRNTLVAQEEAGDFHEAIDLVVDKLERQLTKHKEKLRNHKHPDNHNPRTEKR